MPKAIVETHPNKKVTDFFRRKQPVFEVLSTSENRSVISISSDEVLSAPSQTKKPQKASSLAHSMSARPQVTSVASQSALSLKTRTCRNTPSTPNAKSNLTPLNTTSTPPRTGQKRKKELIIISSEESDDVTSPVYPVIHVKGSSTRRGITPSFSQALSATPLTPRQNLQNPSPRPISLKPLSSPHSSKPLSQNSRQASFSPSKHRPSPPKRPRYDSPKKEVLSALDCDADDESEIKNLVISRRASLKSLNASGTASVPMDEDGAMPLTVISDFEDGAGQSTDGAPSARPRNEVLPSSQEGEIELPIDEDKCDGVPTGECQDLPFSPGPVISTSVNLTPTKARTHAIIAGIRAKAEARAAAEAERDHILFQCGLTSDGDDSELSSLSSTNEDEDDDHLNLNIEDALPVQCPALGSDRLKLTIDLLDDSLFTPLAPRQAASKAKATICPLDMLIKNNKREESRKALLIQSRRKHGEVPSSDIDLDDEEFHPQYRAGMESQRSSSPGATMKEHDRNELLGIEGSEAVGKILEKDKKRKTMVENDNRHIFTFWSESMMFVDDVIPTFPIQSESTPFLESFGNAANRHEYGICSMLLDSGVLAQFPAANGLTTWLFTTAMSTSHSELSLAAYRCLLNIHRHTCTPSTLKLTSESLLISLLRLGANEQVVSLLGCKIEHFVQVTLELKVELARRFVTMLEVLGRPQSMDASEIPVLVAMLVLLSFDASSSHLQQDIIYATEALLDRADIAASVELATCRLLKRLVTSPFMNHTKQTDVLSALTGGTRSSSRIRRWLAWALLGGCLDIEESQWGDMPPLSVFLGLFDREASGTVKLFITKETDYEELTSFVEVLAVALTDIDSYMQKEPNSASLEKTCMLLEKLMGHIVDTRAAHLDRTKAKDAINRLHKRLIYQRDAAIRAKRNGNTGRLEQYFARMKPRVE